MKLFLSAAASAATLGFCLSATAPAQAYTLTFDSLPDYGTVLMGGGTGSPYVENGVTVTSISPWAVLSSWTNPGAVHLDDSGTDMTDGVSIATGSIFGATSFTTISNGYFLSPPSPLENNIVVEGLLGGSVIASAGFALADMFGTVQTFLLDSSFAAIDALVIKIVYPTNSEFCDAPCGHLDLDSVELVTPAPVPLPASGLLLIAATAGLGVAARRRRR